MKNKKLIECFDVCYRHRDTLVLYDINVILYQGTITTIIGPNGGGKTTLGKILAGSLLPTSGKVKRYGKLSIGYMPQKLHLSHLMPLRAIDFLQLSLHKKVPVNAIFKIAEDNSIGAILQRPMTELSGGELQKLLFTRILLQDPQVLILDEPTQGLDLKGQRYFYNQIESLCQQYGKTILIISHDLNIVMRSSNNVICVDKTVCCSGLPDVVQKDNKFETMFKSATGELFSYYQHTHKDQDNA